MFIHFHSRFSLHISPHQVQDNDYEHATLVVHLLQVLSGPTTSSSQIDELHSLVVHTLHISAPVSETQALDNTIRSFWELESFGVPSTDRSLYDELRDTILFRNGRYEVQLPWKMPRQNPRNNYDLSLKRLHGLLRRLKHEPDILTEYDTVIKTQLQE